MAQLYHQIGYRYTWNLQSFQNEHSGDGFILAPRYMSYEFVSSMDITLRRKSIFDPQFYLPTSDRGELQTYPFFPNVLADGFSTAEWNEELASQSAESCLEFQNSCDFKYLVIPTRFHDTVNDYIESQSTLFVNPFINSYVRNHYSKPALLQLILTASMLKDHQNRIDLLNWVTGLEAISGIYIIYYLNPRHKQIDDNDFLLSVMQFVHCLKSAGLEVVIGYSNTESLPLLVSDPDIITMGSYENLRMFNLRAFQAPGGQQQGPNARVYVPKLLQWVDYNYLGAISRNVSDPVSFFEDTQHRIAMFHPSYKWHFSKPEPYKHYFTCFSREIASLAGYNFTQRFDAIQTKCRRAIEHYSVFDQSGIVFDQESNGRHIASWLTALNEFKRYVEIG